MVSKKKFQYVSLCWFLGVSKFNIGHFSICVDFKNVIFHNIWWILDWDIPKILQEHHFKSFLLNYQSSTWALMRPNKLWHHALNCSSVLLSAHEHSLVLLRAHWGSWVVKRLHSKLSKNHWCPCIILSISQSRFHQMVLKMTFLKSAWKDGISWPLGSWEITKAKGEYFLLTL